VTIQLDHLMVPSRDKLAAPRLLAGLLDVPWSPSGIGPFVPVYLNDGLTLDFDEWRGELPSIRRHRLSQPCATDRSIKQWIPRTAGASSTGTSRTVTSWKC